MDNLVDHIVVHNVDHIVVHNVDHLSDQLVGPLLVTLNVAYVETKPKDIIGPP